MALSSNVKEGLLLGQLMGNRFTITLRWECYSDIVKKTLMISLWTSKFSFSRNILTIFCWEMMEISSWEWNIIISINFQNFRGVVADSEETIKKSAESLGKYGFINYFGLQVLFSWRVEILYVYYFFFLEPSMACTFLHSSIYYGFSIKGHWNHIKSVRICMTAFWKWFSTNSPCWSCATERRMERCRGHDSWSKRKWYPLTWPGLNYYCL